MGFIMIFPCVHKHCLLILAQVYPSSVPLSPSLVHVLGLSSPCFPLSFIFVFTLEIVHIHCREFRGYVQVHKEKYKSLFILFNSIH